jgi:hypothetical protein
MFLTLWRTYIGSRQFMFGMTQLVTYIGLDAPHETTNQMPMSLALTVFYILVILCRVSAPVLFLAHGLGAVFWT